MIFSALAHLFLAFIFLFKISLHFKKEDYQEVFLQEGGEKKLINKEKKISKRDNPRFLQQAFGSNVMNQKTITTKKKFIEFFGIEGQSLLKHEYLQHKIFFERIKKQLEGLWRMRVAEKLKIFLAQQKYLLESSYATGLKIWLNEEGYVEKVFLLSESGEKELDQVAITSFKEAQPYINPPLELKNKEGFIEIFINFYVHLFS